MWKFFLHDWKGTTICEIMDASNIVLNTGLNKNSNLSFEIKLMSVGAKELSDRNNYALISAYRYNPYTSQWTLQFIGPVLTTEERSSTDLSSVAITAVGAYWRLTKRIVNDSNNSGKQQSGYAQANATYYVYVADTNKHRIQIYKATNGTYVGTVGSGVAGSANGQFNAPKGVAVGNGKIYVADSGNNRIQVFSQATGAWQATWGGTAAGSGNTQFNNPYDVTVDSSGNVWVSDTGNKRVVKYDKNGNYKAKTPASFTYSSTTFDFEELRRISVSEDGYIYVATSATTTAEQVGYIKIDSSCQPVGAITGIGQWADVVQRYDRSGVLLVTNGGYLSNWGNSISSWNTSGLCKAVDKWTDGTIFVLESNASTGKILKYNAAGNLTNTYTFSGSGAQQFLNAQGFAVAADATNDAIQVAKTIIENTNTLDGNSWIKPATTQGTSTPVYLEPGTWGGYKKLSEAIEELGGAFEWKVTPKLQNAGNASTLVLGEWYANSLLGADKTIADSTIPSVKFEYGTGTNNATEYVIKKSSENLLNRVSYPAADAKPYSVTSEDTTLIASNGLLEEVITGGVLASGLRTALTQLHLRLRKNPRILVEIQPARSDQSGPNNRMVPIPLIDYEPGDFVGVIIQDVETSDPNATRYISEQNDYKARVYDISIEIDDNGQEIARVNLYSDGE